MTGDVIVPGGFVQDEDRGGLWVPLPGDQKRCVAVVSKPGGSDSRVLWDSEDVDEVALKLMKFLAGGDPFLEVPDPVMGLRLLVTRRWAEHVVVIGPDFFDIEEARMRQEARRLAKVQAGKSRR